MRVPEARFTYDHERPAAGADLVLVSVKAQNDVAIAMIKRLGDPYKGFYALPGGHVDPGDDGFGERMIDACIREAKEEIDIDLIAEELTFLKIYDEPHRDPRGWRISACYFTVIGDRPQLRAGDDAAEALWLKSQDITDHTKIAFDHRWMLADALKVIKDDCYRNWTNQDPPQYLSRGGFSGVDPMVVRTAAMMKYFDLGVKHET